MYYATETVLDLVELGIIPQSARQIGQTLTLESAGSLRRLANGELKSRMRPSLRKYRSAISFSDTYPPAFNALWAGDIVTVHCAAELSGKVGSAFVRPHVPGSVIWRNALGDVVASGEDETVAPVGATNFTFRPIIVFMIEGWDLDADEYGAVVSSALNLREV
ncbi:hypothetical protein GHL01_00355 [Sinorhizobium meliloti]|uniref:hypothetical protein n=1 Tax=Rhizobium meliloti TaxID=382 RepID=UPI0012971DCF|nr:hypothetical protein [Sinorhizobium meliloti]MQV12196.1 hypothetical protein [Sinorhizobium meliloti]